MKGYHMMILKQHVKKFSYQILIMIKNKKPKYSTFKSKIKHEESKPIKLWTISEDQVVPLILKEDGLISKRMKIKVPMIYTLFLNKKGSMRNPTTQQDMRITL